MSVDVESLTENIRLNSQQMNSDEFWIKYIANIFGHVGTNTFFIYDFLSLERDSFIFYCYQKILERSPTPEEILHGLKFNPSNNEGKTSFLDFILLTPEFFAKNRTLNFIGMYEAHPVYYRLFRLKNKILFSVFSQLTIRGWIKKKLLTFFSTSTLKSLEKNEYFFFLNYNCSRKADPWLKLIRLTILKISRFCLFLCDLILPFLFQSKSQFQVLLNQSFMLYQTKQIKDLRRDLLSAKDSHPGNLNSRAPSVTKTTPSPISQTSTSGYFEFENLFRGSEELVRERLSFYIPHLKNIYQNLDKALALDVGFGRCEWLSLLRDEGIPSLGVDIDPDLVQRAISKGFNAVNGAASDWLKTQKNNSFGLVTAFHVVEHLSFDVLLDFLRSSYDALVPGGGLIIETPNPENLLVGSFEFWIDPTHVRPYPSQTLQFWISTIGFKNVQVIKLNPYNILPSEGLSHEAIKNLVYRANLERDYAIIARK